jgi:hypothetical protein
VGGDTADKYFQRTEFIAGVKDMRFQALMPDVLHWLGIKKIDRMLSMSNHKYDAIVSSGIEIVERVPIPDEMIPADSRYSFFHGCKLKSWNITCALQSGNWCKNCQWLLQQRQEAWNRRTGQRERTHMGWYSPLRLFMDVHDKETFSQSHSEVFYRRRDLGGEAPLWPGAIFQ